MTETQNCPFCSQGMEAISIEVGHQFDFDCPTCGRFLIFNKTLRRLNEGEDAAERPVLLDFIKSTPADKIAYFGHRFNDDVPPKYKLYKEYRPLKSA